MRFRSGLALALALAAAPVACAGSSGSPGVMAPSSPSPLLGQEAPNISKRTLAGERIDTGDAAGQVIVVEFFAEYCKPCQETVPQVQKLADKQKDVMFVGVSLDEYQSSAQAMVAKHGVTFPVVHDAGGLRGRFRVTELPATFVIEPGGNVHWVRIGGNGAAGSELAAAIADAKTAAQAPAE